MLEKILIIAFTVLIVGGAVVLAIRSYRKKGPTSIGGRSGGGTGGSGSSGGGTEGGRRVR